MQKSNYCAYALNISDHFVDAIIMMMEVTDKGRACLPVYQKALQRPKMSRLIHYKYMVEK